MNTNPCSFDLYQNFVINLRSETPVDQLPKDLLTFALTHIDNANKHVAKGVSRSWEEAVLNGTCMQQNMLYSAFCDVLIEKLQGKYPHITTEIKKNSIASPNDLIEIKSQLLQLREKIMTLLKTVEKEDLIFLQDASTHAVCPLFFDQISYLVDVEKRVDEALKGRFRGTIINIALELSEKGLFQRAMKLLDEHYVGYDFPIDRVLGEDIKKTAIVLGKKGSLDQAFSLVQTLAKYQRKSVGTSQFDSALKAIISEFFDLGRIDLSNQLFEFISNGLGAYHFRNGLAKKIYELKKIDALILPTINTPEFPAGIFYDYLHVLIENNDTIADEVIDLIQDEKIKKEAWDILLYS